VRKGHIKLDGKSFTVGLFDYSNNGLYDDDDDVVLASAGANGLLRYADAQGGTYALNDVFPLGDHKYKIRRVDRYGTWMEIEPAVESLTSYFTERFDSLMTSGARSVKLKPEFWENKFVSREGDSVSLRSMKGAYLLLNFWEDGCQPCLDEMPVLVEARKAYPDSVIRFVSFVKIGSKEKVEKILKESGMTWAQIPLTDDVQKIFRVRGYPSNILISPNGEECVSQYGVKPFFFKKYVK
jgi:thiol-disulfide isomerase/thioredoxin